jgi:uncharacterized protein YlxW (UPF0749 family)
MHKFIVLVVVILLIAGVAYAYDYVTRNIPAITLQSASQRQIDELRSREQELRTKLSMLESRIHLLQEENRALELQLQIERAKSDLELAQGQRAILEAAAATVDTNRWLVAWNAVRGDVILIIVLIFIVGLLLLASFYGMSIYIRMRRRESKFEVILPTYKIR